MTLREQLQQTDRAPMYRVGNLYLSALASALGQDVRQLGQDDDYIFKFLYEQAQTPDREQQYYQILIEPFTAQEGADNDA